MNKTQTDSAPKGVLDVLFGGKGGAAQAADPSDGGGEVLAQSPEEFIAALAQAQDQKDAKAAAQAQSAQRKAAVRTKGGSKGEHAMDAQAVAGKGSRQQKEAGVESAAAEQAQALALVLAQLQAQKTDAADEKAQGTTPLSRGTQPRGVLQSPQQTPPAPAGARGPAVPGGVPGIGAEAAAQQQLKDAVIAAQEAAIASQRAAIGAQDASIKAHEAALRVAENGQRGAVAMQPIVIQTPLAIPVEVLDVKDVEDGDGGGAPVGPAVGGPMQSGQPGAKTGLSSQDFLAQLNGSVGAVGAAKNGGGRGQSAFDQSGDGDSGASGFGRTGDELSSLAMAMPQVGPQHASGLGQAGGQAIGSADGTIRVGVTSSGRPELLDTVALASQVSGVADRGGGEVRVKIHPESLGELTINVQHDGGRLNVHFEAQTQQAREALSAAMPELRQVLSASRYDVGHLEVRGGQSAATLALVRENGGIGMSGWSGGNQSQDWQQGSQEWGRNSNSWERYFEQRQGRQDRGQRGYQQYEEAMGS